MQRLFFHLVYDNQLDDPDGSELESLDAALEEARAIIRDRAASQLRAGAKFTLKSVRICTEEGRFLEEVWAPAVYLR